MANKISIHWFAIAFLLVFSLSSCKFSSVSTASSTTQPTLQSLTPQVTPVAATPVDQETSPESELDPAAQQLTICLGQEPDSLFWYAPLSPAAYSILAAVYDGPFDRVDFTNLPVILESVPTFAAGDIQLESVSVEPGSRVADIQGNPVVLVEGVPYRPSGCNGIDCSQVFTGTTPVAIDQMVIRFHLKPGLKWSDGASLTAADSLFSFQATRALQPQGWFDLLDATWSYQQVDELTLEWRGLPGYLGGDPVDKFFLPLPRHAWESIGWVNLPAAKAAAQMPLGWGPYKIDSWKSGDRLNLSRNPNYHRAGEGLPVFEHLVYRFVPDPELALQDLRSGACDLLDPTVVYENRLEEAAALQAAGELKIHVQPASAWEQITFGIVPAEPGKVNVFNQPEVRLAAAQCIDRQAIASQVLAGLAQPAESIFPPGHPDAVELGAGLNFDPQAGQQRLDSAGWRDQDNDSSTPRVAQSVAGFADGTPLQVEYLVSPDPDRQVAAQLVRDGLQGCGFAVNISTLPFTEYLAPGPQGPVFGRYFELAQFAWPVPNGNPGSLCALYLSNEVPGPYPDFPRGWGGGNAGGYANPAYDQACRFLLAAPAEWPAHTQAVEQVQQLLAAEEPVVPLYWRFRAALVRPDLCGLDDANLSSNWLSNLEAFRRDPACP